MKGAVTMNDELISKKDLLDATGISYGQLYRWKRKNLIPEEWFIRKSTFTGQETFFPKEKILERIEKIQLLKDNLSLDELAEMFSPSVTNINLTKEKLIKRNIVSKESIDYYLEQKGTVLEFSFEMILQLFILDKLLQSGKINLEEGKMLLELLNDCGDQVAQKNSELILIRKFGISSCLLVSSAEKVQFEKGTKVVVQLSIDTCIEELKTKLM
jgi:DNA-binding transcriptional MerR regulator